MKKKFANFAIFFAFAFFAENLTACGGDKSKCIEGKQYADLTAVLNNGRFSGVLDKDASISRITSICEGAKVIDVYFYTREFGSGRLTQRLIFVSGKNTYVGMFAIDDEPKSVGSNKINFDYEADVGNSIEVKDCSVPEKAYLNGEAQKLFK